MAEAVPFQKEATGDFSYHPERDLPSPCPRKQVSPWKPLSRWKSPFPSLDGALPSLYLPLLTPMLLRGMVSSNWLEALHRAGRGGQGRELHVICVE